MTDKCCLCNYSDKDSLKYGDFLTDEKNEIAVHYFCMLLSANLVQRGDDDEGFLGFLFDDIIKESRRIKNHICAYCKKRNANIACCKTNCRVFSHLKCGYDNGIQFEFKNTFRSFCPKHYSFKQVPYKSTKEICHICKDNLGKFNILDTLKAPCCQNGWFHRWCLIQYASTSGYFFKCPLCQNSKKIREVLPLRGVFIPDRDAAWETEPNAFQDLLERPNKCAAFNCKSIKGRKFTNQTQFSFLYCNMCGGDSIHEYCANVSKSNYYCKECTTFVQNKSISADNDESSSDEDKEIDIIGIDGNCEASDKSKRISSSPLANICNIQKDQLSADDKSSSLERNDIQKNSSYENTMSSIDSISNHASESGASSRSSFKITDIGRNTRKRRARIILDSEDDISDSSDDFINLRGSSSKIFESDDEGYSISTRKTKRVQMNDAQLNSINIHINDTSRRQNQIYSNNKRKTILYNKRKMNKNYGSTDSCYSETSQCSENS